MAPTASVQALATSRSSRARLRWSDLSRRKASSRLPWAPMQFYTRPRWRGWANGGSPRGCQDLLESQRARHRCVGKALVDLRSRRIAEGPTRLTVFLEACVRDAAGTPSFDHGSSPGAHGVRDVYSLVAHIAPRNIREAPRSPPFFCWPTACEAAASLASAFRPFVSVFALRCLGKPAAAFVIAMRLGRHLASDGLRQATIFIDGKLRRHCPEDTPRGVQPVSSRYAVKTRSAFPGRRGERPSLVTHRCDWSPITRFRSDQKSGCHSRTTETAARRIRL